MATLRSLHTHTREDTRARVGEKAGTHAHTLTQSSWIMELVLPVVGAGLNWGKEEGE